MHIRIRPLIGALCLGPVLNAQTVLDGAYIKEHIPTRRAIPYVHLREADVMVAQRVWRTIDLREKINHPLYYPLEPSQGRKSLFDVILDGLLENGSLTAYDPGVMLQDDDFERALTTPELEGMLNAVDTVWTPGLDDPDTMIPVVQPQPVTTAQVTRYLLKEDWIFDKQRGVMEPRIIGLAPLREVRGDDGELRGHAPLFWLYFPELRYVLANAQAFERNNDAGGRSFDKIFQDRLFSSYITKVSNAHDRGIIEYATGLDVLLQGEAVKEHLFRTEFDLWNY
ncbi:MAG: gliding motility protein GldN [Flavobacteriales bacterium]|nr:gliding motility protein GldN [Flavobacteriales bacterium]